MVFKLLHSQVTLLATVKGVLLSCSVCREILAEGCKLKFPLILGNSGKANDQSVLGKKATYLNQLFLLDAPLESTVSLSLKAVLIWTGISIWAEMAFLKACPFQTPL